MPVNSCPARLPAGRRPFDYRTGPSPRRTLGPWALRKPFGDQLEVNHGERPRVGCAARNQVPNGRREAEEEKPSSLPAIIRIIRGPDVAGDHGVWHPPMD